MNDRETVFIVDDDPHVAEAIAAVVATQSLHTAVFHSGEDLIAKIAPVPAACVIADLQMPGMSGIDLMCHMRELGFDTPVILVTGRGDIPQCVTAMQKGAFYFLEKPFRPGQLVEIVNEALAFDRRRRQAACRHQSLASRLTRLTGDERSLLDLLLEGKLNKEIAADLDISIRTVQFRVTGLLKKMGVRSRTELVHGLVIAARKAIETQV